MASRPEDEEADTKKGVRRFFPFSLGERDCLGRNLAKMTVAATIAYLLSHFSFRLADKVCLAAVSL
jgi:cytochrome P450